MRDRLRLPPKIQMAAWAEKYRIISPPAAQPGPWVNARAPYLAEVMDTISGRDYQDITLVKLSQSGGTEVILNAIGYFIDQEPSSILCIQPNVKPMAQDFSKDRLAPLFRDTPQLAGKVRDPRARDSGNTILHKEFPGGQLTVVGANSPAGLASRPIRIVLADELDRWPSSAGSEGDPLSLARARQITYRHRRKTVKVSSPGNDLESRIDREWKLSDQRHYYVPCPHCSHMQPLEWRDSGGTPDIRPGKGAYRLIWEKKVVGEETIYLFETAAYTCRHCACTIDETHKAAMLAAGAWVKHNPSSRRAGFHISGLLSPWVRWSELGKEWIDAKGDDEQRKTFFNTKLGLLYVALDGDVDGKKLASAERRESYGDESVDVPIGVGVLTMFIDVQDDRIECDVWGWGAREEAWHIRLERFHGDPDLDDVWERAEALRLKAWRHASGAQLRIRVVMVDQGYKKDPVFRWVKTRQAEGVFASKGVDGAKQPLSRATRPNQQGIKAWYFDPNTFKDVLFPRLRRKAVGAGYMHFGSFERTGADDTYFLQYEAETRSVNFVKNQPVVTYKNPGKKRNEAIDHYVGNLIALRSRGRSVTDRLAEIVAEVVAEGEKARAAAVAAGSDSVEIEEPEKKPKRRRPGGGRGGGWMDGFRG